MTYTTFPLVCMLSNLSLTPFYEGSDAELKLNLRKLAKKDTTTKLKALQELCDMFQTRDTETLKECLEHWCYIYPKLLLDNDRKIRISTHEAMSWLIIKVKRRIMPYLESHIMGWWFMSWNENVK